MVTFILVLKVCFKIDKAMDEKYIPEHKSLYTISNTVSNRLSDYNKISSEVLYPPQLMMNYSIAKQWITIFLHLSEWMHLSGKN